MRKTAMLLLPLFALLSQPGAAQIIPYRFSFEEIGYGAVLPPKVGGERLDDRRSEPARVGRSIYGPFRVVGASRASMSGVTDSSSPAAFAAMIRDHPRIATIEMIDCPGTEDDSANLRLGRLIHAKGIATHVPANGWVASGAVELFLAGSPHWAEPGAQFAVHSWEDDTGRGPQSYSPNGPENRAYLDYYRTLGMSESDSAAFYAMTNATPFSRPRYLTENDMARWIGRAPTRTQNTLALKRPARAIL